jgi:hypothetical protein
MDRVVGHARTRILAASFLSLLVVSYVDYVTGYESLFFVFYFIPVALCAWFLCWRTTFALACLSGVSLFIVDKLDGHPYSREAFRYWNSFMCFAAFALIGLVVYRLRLALHKEQHARQELAAALADLNHSTERIRHLQTNLQVVCAWTKRIRVDGQWIPLDQFLAKELHLSISHGISPEALEEIKKSMDDDKSRGGGMRPGELAETSGRKQHEH